jgi:phage shock protein E
MLIVDVRTKEEWDGGHIDGALHVPLDELMAGVNLKASKSEKIVVYCRSGNRSAMAAHILTARGYRQVVNAGSMNEASAYQEAAGA